MRQSDMENKYGYEKHEMSPELRAFLQSWQDWVDMGAPNGEPYARGDGLCACAVDYLVSHPEHGIGVELRRILSSRWHSDIDSPRNPAYPFGGEHLYDVEIYANTAYMNPQRLAWVAMQLSAD
jgi:hypothetical protein